MKIKLLILLLVFSLSAEDKFEKLRQMKQSTKSSKVIQQSQENSSNKLLEIKYFDINYLDTDYLEEYYSLYLQECIADGICIFKYNGEDNINQIVRQIQTQEKKIRSIREYKKYNFKPF